MDRVPNSPVERRRAFTPKELCEALGISRTTLWRRTKDGTLPPPIRIGHMVRFPPDVVEQIFSRDGEAA